MANSFNYKDQKLAIGDTITVSLKVVEGDKTRYQDFTGLLIAISGREINKSFTVRKISTANVGVERILPVGSPEISAVKLVSKGSARRSKLYYLRDRLGKSALRVKAPSEVKTKETKKNEPTKSATGSKRRAPSKKATAK